jgi:FlaA1/EpsC-like NDP-sugar epimerase
MEKLITDFSLSLFLWQTFVLVLICAIIYFTVKLYKKVMRYLEYNSKK